jgi:hypothetical protein
MPGVRLHFSTNRAGELKLLAVIVRDAQDWYR